MKNYKHNPKLCTVIVTEESGTLIRTPNGEIISGLIFTRVDDHFNGPTTVIAKFHVNIEVTNSNKTVTKND